LKIRSEAQGDVDFGKGLIPLLHPGICSGHVIVRLRHIGFEFEGLLRGLQRFFPAARLVVRQGFVDIRLGGSGRCRLLHFAKDPFPVALGQREIELQVQGFLDILEGLLRHVQ